MENKSLGPFVTLSLKLPLAWSRTLKEIAAQQQRSVEAIIVDAISEYVFKHQVKSGSVPTNDPDQPSIQ